MVNATSIVLFLSILLSVSAFKSAKVTKQSTCIAIRTNPKIFFSPNGITKKASNVLLFGSTVADIQKPSPIKRFVVAIKNFFSNFFENLKKFFKRQDSKTLEVPVVFETTPATVKVTPKPISVTPVVTEVKLEDSNASGVVDLVEARRIVEKKLKDLKGEANKKNVVIASVVSSTAPTSTVEEVTLVIGTLITEESIPITLDENVKSEEDIQSEDIKSAPTLTEAIQKIGHSINEFNMNLMRRIEEVDGMVAEAIAKNLKESVVTFTPPVVQVIKPMMPIPMLFAVPEYMKLEYGPVDPFTSH